MPECLKCKCTIFEVKNLRFEPKIKKRIVTVVVPCNVCQNCNSTVMNNEQMNGLRRATADSYRETHGLLTSKEIITYREKLGLSQIGFASFLCVGEASIKRWETYYIQDMSQDDHIRVKCDPFYSESNYFYLQSKYVDIDIYSGLRPFSFQLVRQISKFFEKADSGYLMYLRKLHFYTDFLHFKRHNRCITGMRYIPLKSGPAPYNHQQLFHFIESERFDPPKNSYLDDNEKKTIEDICTFFLQDHGERICDLSTKEKGFLETNDTDFISYGYAKDLLI